LRLWLRAAEKDLRRRRRDQENGAAPAALSTTGEATHSPACGSSSSLLSSLLARVADAQAPTAPKDPGAGLSQSEVAAILELKKRYPSTGPAQLRAELKRFKGWRLSIRAIARALKQSGYELEHRRGRPEEPEPPRGWEAPYRNALWQIDFTEVRLPQGRRALGVVLDDFSRFIVSWGLFASPTSADIVAMLKEAIRRHGKPLAIYTDRAGPFLAWGKPEGLERFLEAELIDQHSTRA
jgi:transposase InsO family protein